MPAISIIIPVYKTERWLRRCLDSMLVQTFTGWECVLVDDGSPDGCPSICDEYAARDRRFRVLHQANDGTAHARDAGIRKADTEFVTFVDSDDWIDADALEALYAKQRETDADVVLGSYREIYSHKIQEYVYPEITGTADVMVYYFLNPCKTLWGKLFRRALFDNYQVPFVNIGEDAIVTAQIFSEIMADKLQKTDAIVYNYDHRTAGITMRETRKPQLWFIYGFPAY